MIKIILNGARGKMGRTIAELVEREEDMQIAAGVDTVAESGKFPIYDSIIKIEEKADVIVDFSNPRALENLCSYASSRKIPMVVGTTGFEESHKKMLVEVSKDVPVFVSHNMSLGVYVTVMLAKQAARILGDFDVEIVERHHNQKIDAPSGTALMIADAIKEVRNEAHYVYCRADRREKRDRNEIGIHSIRAGNLVGEHRVIFGGEDETIEISHLVTSRKVLAAGALKAARFIITQAPGYYTMADLVKSLES
ncbi:4-hydroxy-tetrahydrodipicolinate reductase [Thermosediminibacter oceani]|uniref:4-hydroxy-tetrahydrodipicolinate reductase n=1 Tax=Thermosediminibacter oceani (strain ATCC BAA-1034 / DSM 16646 / JW/IW-1228P) TaxID=555079 RepID=D9S2M4_THEOJ|nr:4-hydroxy-tetrahydrodipicolinate reductase [Thermosediminibacter oceani]ADL07651.1 dihydrodipicolinate reductase [Thermosediminibacter oceani DSM 16646]